MSTRLLALCITLTSLTAGLAQDVPGRAKDAPAKEALPLVGRWRGDRYLGSYFLRNRDYSGAELWDFRADGTFTHHYAPRLGRLRQTKGSWRVEGKHRLVLEVPGAKGKSSKEVRDFSFQDGFLVINYFGTGEFSQLSRVGGPSPKVGAPKEGPKAVPVLPARKNKDFHQGLALFLGKDGKRDVKAAFAHFEKAAGKGHAPAQFYLAVFYTDGFDVVGIDRKTAIAWLEKAAAKGYAPAQGVLGMAYLEPWTGVKKDVEKAWGLLGRSTANLKAQAADGDLTAQMVLADMYNSGRGLRANYREGMRLVELGAKQGHPLAEVALAKSYFVRDRDYARSLPAFQELANVGHATSQTFLAGHYLHGRGVPKDADRARQWLEKAAAQNESAALYLLGGMWEAGQGVAKDEGKAVAYYRKAGDTGLYQGWVQAGKLLSKGDAARRTKGLELLRLAADADYVPAMFELGELHSRGDSPDEREAAKWYEKAARAGHAGALRALTQPRGKVADLISARHNRAQEKLTPAEQKLEDRVADLATIRDRLYLDLFARNGIFRPPLEKSIRFHDDDPVADTNEAVAEMMRTLRVASAARTRALMSSSGQVRGIGNRAGYLKGMEQIYELSLDHLQTAWKCQRSVSKRVWDEMTPAERARCEKHQPRFAREVNGANEKALADLDEKLRKAPADSARRLERARLYALRFDYSNMKADLDAVIVRKDAHSAYAAFLRGRHYADYGMRPFAEGDFERVLGAGVNKDARIDYAYVRGYLRR